MEERQRQCRKNVMVEEVMEERRSLVVMEERRKRWWWKMRGGGGGGREEVGVEKRWWREEEGLGIDVQRWGGAQRPLSGGGRSPLCHDALHHNETHPLLAVRTRQWLRSGVSERKNTFLSLTPERSHAGLHETLALLTSQLRPDANHQEDMVFLQNVFSEKSLGYLMKVVEELQSGPMSSEEKELLHLLTSPHLKAKENLQYLCYYTDHAYSHAQML
ncbi:hypothetical protein CRUP_011681 [Coryphaenoides rupestris]|nr:hypothetical protein CRUP_011681 [Coryphaenoides rupestris]